MIPEKNSTLQASDAKNTNNNGQDHWKNFIECIKTRQRPISDIEIAHRSTSTALLGNVALRSKLRIDWDGEKETTSEAAARQYLKREYRKPWKLEV